MDLPPELVQIVYSNITSPGLLAYYIRSCKPSGSFVVSVVRRPDYFLSKYGMSMQVYMYLVSNGFKLHHDIRVFIECAPLVLVKAVMPYHKFIVPESKYSATKYFSMTYSTLGLDGCKGLLTDLIEEYSKMRHDRSYMRHTIVEVFNKLDVSDLDWFIDNVIVGDEEYSLDGETSLITSIKLLTYKSFIKHHVDKLHSAMILDMDMAYTIRDEYKDIQSGPVHVECAMLKEEHFLMAQEINKDHPSWSISCTNVMRWSHTDISTTYGIPLIVGLGHYFERDDEISMHIKYYTGPILEKMDFHDMLYIIDSALYISIDIGITMIYSIAYRLKSHGVYTSYDYLMLYLITGNIQYYHKIVIARLCEYRIRNLIYKHYGMVEDFTPQRLCVCADGNCIKDITEALDEYKTLHTYIPIRLNGLNDIVELWMDDKTIKGFL